MSTSFTLPDLGEGVHEAEILKIHVSPGQEIKEGEIILEVETDKAAVEIPSPFTGMVSRITVEEGDFAKVGDVLIVFNENTVEEKSATEKKMSPKKTTASLTLPVPASPATRRIARELGVNLRDVPPTGHGGIVTREDVEKFAAAENVETAEKQEKEQTVPELSPSALPDFSKWGEIERIPFRSIRRTTARKMSESWSRIPHVYCHDMVDITKLEEFRIKHKEEIEESGGRLTLTVFALKAVVAGLTTFPFFNASLDTKAKEIILKKFFHIGVAMDSGSGLVVPVIRDVERKSIRDIAIELHKVVTRARTGTLSREEMSGSTFTITNTGPLGGAGFTAIINYPEVAILGMGQGRRQPVVTVDDHGREKIVVRLIMPVVLGFDHRVVDGADAIRFLRLIIDSLKDPDELLITMI
ncbi:dihydrolipoamide acetyltransferase component of pyruvate dehydrogenase complex [Desulfomarina profundi]|uniref:Dihydrolipoamide acetyltransferase component of pyruvate dehydrogenase complex n=1 Tax=Desulfomarina profundi TaxID=2772557 RepID=A0A8D5FVC0_9BACT|nr:dihydrolipoamide acetyltransferase family protein [Desulfomarina profundi]BCL62349.1 dihydrolipoamide acetyltransferase component of pyruvate dehydrogenase complex [Desulfomarina profundi]